jgi:hypothetical protein
MGKSRCGSKSPGMVNQIGIELWSLWEIRHNLEWKITTANKNNYKKVEQVWLTRYFKHQELNFDRGSEFVLEFAGIITNEYGIVMRQSTVWTTTSSNNRKILAFFPRKIFNEKDVLMAF